MKKKILVIEDEPVMRKMIANRLKSSGYEVLEAEDGNEGVDKVKETKPDLVISDLALPNMTGNVIVRILKMSEEFKHIPIIIVSAFIRPNAGAGLEVPADYYLPKPFTPEKLLEVVEEFIKK